jgi:signal transduction histidine kinase
VSAASARAASARAASARAAFGAATGTGEVTGEDRGAPGEARLGRQFAVVIATAFAPVLAVIVAFGLLMVISGDAAMLIGAVVLAAGVAALAGAAVVARRLTAERVARERAESARRELIAAVSHDLRTPITSLRLLAQAIEDDIVDGERRQSYATRMGTHIRALSALIDDLFELSRLEAGEIRWTLEQVPLDPLLQETIEAMRADAEARGVRVSLAPNDGGTVARANPEQLQRVLFNLIQNAIRHTPADGSVVIHAEPAESTIEIEVADTGSGIAAEDRDHVFAAFYRSGADAARTGEGAGLGLAVARAIVEAHGGRIWLAESARGTRVRFSLPAVRLEGFA